LVGFQVSNSLDQNSFGSAVITDQEGLASIGFRIPNVLSSNGTWTAVSVFALGEEVVSDTMSLSVYLHNVAVADVAPARTWVYQGHVICINVTVANKGYFENAIVTLYCDVVPDQVIGMETVDLVIGESRVLTFTWKTTGVPFGNYTMTAVASIDFPENDPSDNTVTEGKMKVRILGDIDGNDLVDLVDLWSVARSFGFNEKDLGWNADADMNLDGTVNMVDLYLTTSHFGEPS
jgi:hypothetical protein